MTAHVLHFSIRLDGMTARLPVRNTAHEEHCISHIRQLIFAYQHLLAFAIHRHFRPLAFVRFAPKCTEGPPDTLNFSPT